MCIFSEKHLIFEKTGYVNISIRMEKSHAAKDAAGDFKVKEDSFFSTFVLRFTHYASRETHYSVRSEGSTGIAPFLVQTNADVRTAIECASGTDFPLRMLAINAAVNESPAPTVSATSTFGVGWKETFPGVNT